MPINGDGKYCPTDTKYCIKPSTNITYEYTPNNLSNPTSFCLTTIANSISYKVTDTSSPAQGDRNTYGLVVSLDAGNSASYPGSGTTWTDLSGNGNNGTLTNAVGYSASNSGTLTFDGVDDWVNVGNLGSFYNQGTIAFWMNASVVENWRNPFTTKYNGVNSCIRFEENSSGTFGMLIGDDSGNYGGANYLNSGLTANTWYHVVLVWDKVSNNAKGYLNGVGKFNQSQTLWPTTLPAIAVGNGFSSDRYWLGRISAVSIYNRVLSIDEVQQNFNNLKGRYGL
jgi:hypothetical protein